MHHVLAATLVSTLAIMPIAGKAAQPAVCTVDHQSPSIAATYPVETPVLAKILNLTGTTRVRVDISGSGRLSGTSVAKSSGYDILDKAAVAAVAALKFNPETQACAPVAGSYAVDVEFANN